MVRTVYKIPYLLILLIFSPVASVVQAEVGGVTTYDCTAAGGLTRQIKSEEHCEAERLATPGMDACRVTYVKEGVSEILWRARNNAAFCYPKVQNLVSTLEASGFSCTGEDKHISCDDSDKSAESADFVGTMPEPPPPEKTSNSGPGAITITPSEPSEELDPFPQLLRETYFSAVTGIERDYFVYLPVDFQEREHWPAR